MADKRLYIVTQLFRIQSQYEWYGRFLKALSPEDRQLRFSYQISDDQIDAHVLKLWLSESKGNLPNTMIYIATFGDDIKNTMAAAIEIAVCGDTAEVGLVVAEGYRGQGLGTRLFDLAIGYAKGRDCSTMYSYCLAHNRFMYDIAKKQGMKLNVDHGDVVGELILREPEDE